jgi:hypothetical protein
LTPVKRTNGVALLRPRASPRIASRSTLRSRTRTDWRSRVTRQTEAAKRGLHPSVLEGAADEENLIGGKVAKRILDDEHRVGLRLALDLGAPASDHSPASARTEASARASTSSVASHSSGPLLC